VVTVVIPTYDGAKKISNLLTALCNQSLKDFKVVVVIDGSTDDTNSVVANYSERLNLTIHIQTNKGRSGAKNSGARLAEDGVLIFYDDDTVPEGDSVSKHVSFHEQNSECILGGNLPETYLQSKTDIQNYRSWLTNKWTQKYPQSPVELAGEDIFFSSANCSMKRSTFNFIGGFDERLPDAEDLDFALRASKMGVRIYFDKSNSAVHNDSLTCRSYILRQRQYKSAHQMLVKLHPDLVYVRGRQHQDKLAFIKYIFYFGFSFGFWPKLIDANSYFLIVPRPWRYKIYDWVIHAQSKIFPGAQ
jgi:GT2 family glycosyltransferase